MSRLLRAYGRSYSKEDLDGIGQEICNKDNIKFKYSSIDGYNNALVIVGLKGEEEVSKRIPFSSLRSYKLYSRVNEKPYYEVPDLVFYKDELEEAAIYFATHSFSKYLRFNISHKKSNLNVYVMDGFIPNKLEVPLYEVDRYLMRGNNLFKKPYA